MKRALCLSTVALCLVALQAFGGSGSKNVVDSSKNTGPVVELNPPEKISFEFDVEETYVGGGNVERDSFSVRNFNENDFLARFVFTPRVKFGILRLGFSYEGYDFGFGPDNQVRYNGFRGGFPGVPLDAEIPNRLQAANFVVGLDTEFTDSFLIRIEAHPGWYGGGEDMYNRDTFRVPFIAGMTYVYSPSLQFTLGAGVNFEGKYPVLPGGGVRWQITPQWVLDAVVPRPRLEFEATRNLTLYAGAVIKNDTFRVDEDFGARAGIRRLDNAYLNYTEVRTGLGIEWKATPEIAVALEGGYQPYREFDYQRVHVRYHEDGGQPYGTLGIHMAF